MAEWLAGQFMDKLTEKLTEKVIDIGSNYLKDQIRWQTGMKEELDRLRQNQAKIRAVVSAAIQAQKIDPNSEMNNWIWRLRDAFDEADDVLDDFDYMKHKEQLPTNMARSAMNSLKKIGKRAFKIDPNLKALENVVHKLDKISAEVILFRDLLKDTQQEQKAQQDKLQNDRETGSMPKEDVLIGRGQDKEFVIQWLGKLPIEEHQSHVSAIPNMYHNISLLSIVGHGGMGKTTLLQHIYRDEVAEEFDIKMWICVSNNFNVKEVIKSILESLTKTRPSEELLDTLQNNLQSKVTSKKFLLVLDDIWEENEVQDKIKWESVLAPLAYGGLGSKILITTRMDSVASMIAKVIKKHNEQFILEGLKNDECLQLLNTHAFAGVQNPNNLKKLRSITKELVKKLYGSPLAAKVIGGVLNSSMDERHWTNILNNVMGYNDMLAILKLSYISLPEYLQNCFAFCSIFAQDHVFDKDDLVQMWIAVGFIQPSNIQGEDLEDIGRRYIDILVKKSLFEKNKKGYKMHDLLQELAQSVSAHECFRIVSDEDPVLDIPKTIRHLSIQTTNLELLKKLGKFKNLRTLCISYGSYSQHFDDVLTKIFEETRSIRLLSIDANDKEMKLKAIKCLKHLRYLEIKFNPYFELPSSVTDLFHLQFLICDRIYDIPRDMNNLSNLRYSNLPLFKSPGIGKLKFLHELKMFTVKNEAGYRIGELQHMNDLLILKINGLQYVRDVEEACKAKLCDKKKLTDLSLEWGATSQNIADLDRYARVLDNLQPHKDLKKLKMKYYMGVRSATWMNDAILINNLEFMELVGCLEWQNLPPFGKLPFLKHLRLLNMPKAVRFDNRYHGNVIHCLFPSLEELYIGNLEALEDWFDVGVDCLFPCLTKLMLLNCPNLRELPYLPPKLRILKINNIGWKTLNHCSSISKSILLETLEVKHCPDITIIPLTSEIIGRPIKMHIVDCPNLLSLGEHQEVETTENCSNISKSILLQRLAANQCPNITVIPQTSEIIARPTTIEIFDCPNLHSLGGHQKVVTTKNGPNLIVDKLIINDPSVLQLEPLRSVTSIKELIIQHNKELVSFPFEAERWFLHVSSSLCHLKFTNLKSLQSLPSSFTSLSSLESLSMDDVPQLQLHQSSFLTISSLNKLELTNIPLLKSLSYLPPSLCLLELIKLDNLDCLPSCLSSLSSLTSIIINEVPLLQELPDMPPSLCKLELGNLDKLDCLPSSLSSLSSLTSIIINEVPLLRELPDLPPSLCSLQLRGLDNLDCLPSCLSSLSSLSSIIINKVPLLRELPNLPPSLKNLEISKCDPKFMKCYKQL